MDRKSCTPSNTRCVLRFLYAHSLESTVKSGVLYTVLMWSSRLLRTTPFHSFLNSAAKRQTLPSWEASGLERAGCCSGT